jgi:hypothetical protein
MLKNRNLLVIFALMLLTACQANKVYYASEGHIGVDISGSATVPTNYSVSGTSSELSIIPAKSDGSSHTIYGGFYANLKYLTLSGGNKIKQNFATGEAAVCALYSSNPTVLKAYKEQCRTMNPVKNKSTPVVTEIRDNTLVVATRSVFGADLHYGDADSVGSNFGYKRLVAAAIPVITSAEELGSVYVDINVDSLTSKKDCKAKTEVEQKSCSLVGGMKISQTIATGDSAKLMAIARRADLKKAQKAAK